MYDANSNSGGVSLHQCYLYVTIHRVTSTHRFTGKTLDDGSGNEHRAWATLHERFDQEQQRNKRDQQWNGQQQQKNSFVNTGGRVAESSSHASRSPTIAGDVHTTIRLIAKMLTAALRST